MPNAPFLRAVREQLEPETVLCRHAAVVTDFFIRQQELLSACLNFPKLKLSGLRSALTC